MENERSCATCRHMSFCGKYKQLVEALYQTPPMLNVGRDAPARAGQVIAGTFDQVAAACPNFDSVHEYRIGRTIRIEGREVAVSWVNFPRPGNDYLVSVGFLNDPKISGLEIKEGGKVYVTEQCGVTRQVTDYCFLTLSGHQPADGC